MNDIPSVAEEFWAALAINDRDGAQEVVDRLALPPVETSAFSFEEVEGELEQVRGEEGGDGGSGALSPKAVNSDTPVAVVETWNSDVRVALVLVSKDEICGARVSDGEVDFHACAGALDREGGTSCGWSTHETDGKDAKGRKVLKMELPASGIRAFAIPVKSSGSTVKRPKIFSLPILPKDQLPYDVILPYGWDETLLTLRLRAREWKFFIEAYGGRDWLIQLWERKTGTPRGKVTPPPSVNIPSPRMGRGGFPSDDFEERPDGEDDVLSLESPPRTQGGPSYFARGGRNRSAGSLGSSRASLDGSTGQDPSTAERVASISRRVTKLERIISDQEARLPASFLGVRDEFDLIWSELEAVKLGCTPGPTSGGTAPFFQGRHPSTQGPSTPSVSSPAFQTLLRQVVDELRSGGFVTRDELDAHVTPSSFDAFSDQVSALGRRVTAVEQHFLDPDGVLAKIESRIKVLEDRRAGESIERGGKTFRDIGAVSAWVQTFKDKQLFRYCVDMVTLLMLCADPYQTIAEGMTYAAGAHKAEFNDFTEARVSLSYGLTYPENIMKKHDKEKYAATGGWFWSSTWLSYAPFKGTFNNGAKDAISGSLSEVSQMIQNAIDYAFPLSTHPLPHAVFTEQLLLARSQASAWIEALDPLYEILSSSGMATEEAWERVLIFTKAVFDDIRTVRALTLDKGNTAAMIWGSFQTTKLLEESTPSCLQHVGPHVSPT